MADIDKLLATQRPYLTDGGFETWLFFQQGFVAPEFAATVLMEDDDARSAMRKYFDQFLQMETSADIGFILDTNTWRGCTKWAPKLDKTEQEMIELSKNAVEFVKEIRNAWRSKNTPVILNGVIRPSGDGYQPEILSSVVAARDLHRLQIGALKNERTT